MEHFSTIDITWLTPEEKIFQMVGESERPGPMCENTQGFIHKDELEQIANHLGITEEKLKTHFLREVYAYGKVLHKPKHQPKLRHADVTRTSTVHKMPYGHCVFLDTENDKGHTCLLAKAKPLHCKLATQKPGSEKLHSWYMLRHGMDANNPEAIRHWAVYLNTHSTIPGGHLHELVQDKEKLAKILDRAEE